MEEFKNEVVDFDSLPKFESVVFVPLHRDYLNVVYINQFIIAIIASIVASLFLFFKEENQPFVLPIVSGLFIFILLLFGFAILSFRKKGYALREKDILFRKGVIATTTTIIPFNRIQHVALHEGALDRMYDLSELQVFTAGGSHSDLSIAGLPKEQAERIKTFLLNKILIDKEINSDIESKTLISSDLSDDALTPISESKKDEDAI